MAINSQDLDALGWSVIERARIMKTARGEVPFALYEGNIILDGVEFIVPVHVGAEIPETLMGLQWLRTKRLVVDEALGVLTLGEERTKT